MTDFTAAKLSRLPNGLRVVSYEMASAQSASLGIYIGAGARDETPAQHGIAHMLEHMAFKGTTSRSAADIAAEVESVGGYMNAHTSREETAYYIRALPEHLGLAMDILSDILLNTTLPAHELERERGVILQEIGQSLDTPDDLVFDRFTASCYPGQSIGQPILGTADSVSGFSAADLKGFMSSYYGAEQMLVVATGKITHDDIVALASDRLGGLAKAGHPNRQKPAFNAGRDIMVRDLEQSHVIFGLASPPAGDPDRYALGLLSNLYGGSMSSRLFQQVREERGLCYSIFSFPQTNSDSGVFGIYAGTSPEQVDELLAVSAGALADIAGKTEEAELARAKAQLRAGMLMAQESVTGMMESLARQMMIFGQPVDRQKVLDDIEAVSCRDIEKIATRLIETSKPALAVLGPSGPVMDNERLCQHLAG